MWHKVNKEEVVIKHMNWAWYLKKKKKEKKMSVAFTKKHM